MTREEVKKVLDNGIFTKGENGIYYYGNTSIEVTNDGYLHCDFYCKDMLIGMYLEKIERTTHFTIHKGNVRKGEDYVNVGINYAGFFYIEK